ncbi:MAG: phasin family protein [Luteimonas sp.]|nr:phasin family protein [Luteimonas sp.]
MGTPADLPMQLWKANLDLQLRIGRLLQDSGREWMELGTRAVGETVEEGDAEVRGFLRSGDWQSLAALPVDAFWRQAQQRMGDSQAVTQIAVTAQNAFARGLIEALQDWQKDTARILADAGKGAEATADWQAMFAPWLAFQSAFIPPGGKGTKPRGG